MGLSLPIWQVRKLRPKDVCAVAWPKVPYLRVTEGGIHSCFPSQHRIFPLCQFASATEDTQYSSRQARRRSAQALLARLSWAGLEERPEARWDLSCLQQGTQRRLEGPAEPLGQPSPS